VGGQLGGLFSRQADLLVFLTEKSAGAAGAANAVEIFPKIVDIILTGTRPRYAYEERTNQNTPQPRPRSNDRTLDRLGAQEPFLVWTPVDLLDLAARAGVDE
jgi:hypothetical protein